MRTFLPVSTLKPQPPHEKPLVHYTPREIVDYMVDESLKAYMRQNFQNLPEVDQNLDWLLSSQLEGNPFTAKQSERIVRMIENVRIVDPAVGSGAFPMGVLNKLVRSCPSWTLMASFGSKLNWTRLPLFQMPRSAAVQAKIRRSFQKRLWSQALPDPEVHLWRGQYPIRIMEAEIKLRFIPACGRNG